MRTSPAVVIAATAALLSPVVAGFVNSGLSRPAGLRTVPSRGGIAALRAAKAKEGEGQLKNVAGFFYTPAPPPRPWNAIGRIRELNLLQRTVDLGILSKVRTPPAPHLCHLFLLVRHPPNKKRVFSRSSTTSA